MAINRKGIRSEIGLAAVERVRDLTADFPEVEEAVDKFGHTSFRVRDKPFVMLGEGDAGNGRGDVCLIERVSVLDLDPQQQLAFGVERPRVGTSQILLSVKTPDVRRVALTTAAPQPFFEPVADGLNMKGIARRLHEDPGRLGGARVT